MAEGRGQVPVRQNKAPQGRLFITIEDVNLRRQS